MIRKSSVPVVLSGTLDQDESLPSVNIDYVDASRKITHKFIEAGVKRFAFVGGGYSEKAQIDVLSGMKSLLGEHAIELPESAQYIGAEQYLDGEKAYRVIKETNPEVILCISDEQAIGIVHAAQDDGRVIPDDLQVISFNNTRLVKMVRPKLSSVMQPLYDIGAVGMRLLTKYMNDEPIEDQKVVLPYRIEYRGTTK